MRTSTEKTKRGYRPVTMKGVKYATRSAAVIELLRRTNFSQTRIAKKLRVTQPLVSQLAKFYRG